MLWDVLQENGGQVQNNDVDWEEEEKPLWGMVNKKQLWTISMSICHLSVDDTGQYVQMQIQKETDGDENDLFGHFKFNTKNTEKNMLVKLTNTSKFTPV